MISDVFSNRNDSMNLCVIGVPLSSRPEVGELSLPALGREGRAPHTLDKRISVVLRPLGQGGISNQGKRKTQPDTRHVHLIKSPVQLVELEINLCHVDNSAAIRLI